MGGGGGGGGGGPGGGGEQGVRACAMHLELAYNPESQISLNWGIDLLSY